MLFLSDHLLKFNSMKNCDWKSRAKQIKRFANSSYTFMLIFLISFLLHPMTGASQDFTELVLFNGKILTVDDNESIVSAVKIIDDRIVAVGDGLEDINPSAQAQIIDLKGRTVTPGLIDSHIHYFRDSHVPGYLFSDIETAFTIPDLLDALAERTASVPDGEFITAFGIDTIRYTAEEVWNKESKSIVVGPLNVNSQIINYNCRVIYKGDDGGETKRCDDIITFLSFTGQTNETYPIKIETFFD